MDDIELNAVRDKHMKNNKEYSGDVLLIWRDSAHLLDGNRWRANVNVEGKKNYCEIGATIVPCARTVIYRFTSNSMRWRDVVARKNYANIRSKQFEIKIKAKKKRRIALDPPEDGGSGGDDDDDDETCNGHNSYSILHARR